MLNMLNAVSDPQIQIYSIDKLTLFAHLVAKNILPSSGAIYLGQKHNIWLADFTDDIPTTKELKINELPTEVFLDEVNDPYRPQGEKNMIHFGNQKDKLLITYQGKKHEISIQDLKLKPTVHVEANYMIEPVLN